MVYQIFNSSVISGPESLVIPAISERNELFEIVWLKETRIPEQKQHHVLDYFLKFNLKVHIIEIQSRIDLKAIQKLAQLMKIHQLQLSHVHSHDVKASTYTLVAFFYLKWILYNNTTQNKKFFQLISTHHGVSSRRGFLNRAYEMFYSKCILPFFDKILTVCESDRQLLIYSRGLNEKQVFTHRNGVTRKKISLENKFNIQNEILKRWNEYRNEDQIIMGIAARLEAEKNISKAIEVVHILVNQFHIRNIKLLIFGRGQLEMAIANLIQKLSLSEYVVLKGYRSELSDEMAGFDVVMSFSENEGMPINLIEAGWARACVVSSYVNGVKELIPNENYGISFDLTEDNVKIARKIFQVLSNKTKMNSLAQQYQVHIINSFSKESWMMRLFEIYELNPKTKTEDIK